MALTLGTSHAATGTGSVAISQPAGLRVAFTTIPAFLAADPGTPHEYYGLGRVNVGNAWGFLPHVDVVCTPQVVLGLPPGLTVVAWDFAPGVVGTIQELVEDAAPAVKGELYDRAPLVKQSSSNASWTGPASSVVTLSYTVPALRRFWLANMSSWARRIAAATSVGVTAFYWTINGQITNYRDINNNTVGAVLTGENSAGGLWLAPGDIITCTYNDNSTGGTWQGSFNFNGTLFDV